MRPIASVVPARIATAGSDTKAANILCIDIDFRYCALIFGDGPR